MIPSLVNGLYSPVESLGKVLPGTELSFSCKNDKYELEGSKTLDCTTEQSGSSEYLKYNGALPACKFLGKIPNVLPQMINNCSFRKYS